LLSGRFSDWNTANIAALTASAGMLTAENRALLEGFAQVRTKPLPARLIGFFRLGLYRQTRLGHLAMWVALLLRRM